MAHSAIKITDKWQFTIPNRCRDSLKINPGDYLEPEVRDGVLILKPCKQILIHPEQEWFWTPEWQAKENEVEQEIKKKKVHHSKDVDHLMKDLRK